jgi:SSS family solute:Na+ symporter
LLRTGVLILGPAIALSIVTDIDIRWAIAASGLAALLYSAAGGITAVVWTDLIQFGVVLLCVGMSLVLVWGDVPGGPGTVWSEAAASGRLEVASTQLDFGTHLSLWGALLAYGTLVVGIAGTNQQAVQRYLSCTDLKAARRAAFLGWGIGFAALGLSLFLGVTLHSWMQLVPEGAALEAAAAPGMQDRALPLFILHRLPMGIAGLMVAAIFAASMSSMDSAFHSMSTATLVDFVRRFRKQPLDDAQELRLARWLTVGFGVVATGAAVVAASEGKGLLVTMITWLGYVAGPLLGLFALGVLSKRATEFGALAGVAVGALMVILAVLLDIPAQAKLSPLWLAPIALVLTYVVGLLVSLLDHPPPREKVEGLTLGSVD